MTICISDACRLFLSDPDIRKAFNYARKQFVLKKNRLCKHMKKKQRCRECGGNDFCVHGRRKEICIQCGGASMCEHKRERRMCKICKENGKGGTSLCCHLKKRSKCKQCNLSV